jgi:chloride channel 3/4/5
MNARTSSFNRSPNPGARRPSINSRLSFAVSNAEQGESGAPAEAQIEDEIAEIKRYEDFTTIGMAHSE